MTGKLVIIDHNNVAWTDREACARHHGIKVSTVKRRAQLGTMGWRFGGRVEGWSKRGQKIGNSRRWYSGALYETDSTADWVPMRLMLEAADAMWAKAAPNYGDC